MVTMEDVVGEIDIFVRRAGSLSSSECVAACSVPIFADTRALECAIAVPSIRVKCSVAVRRGAAWTCAAAGLGP